jgi:hypothetical protein
MEAIERLFAAGNIPSVIYEASVWSAKHYDAKELKFSRAREGRFAHFGLASVVGT